MRIEIRPTIAADLPHVIDVPLPYRIRAVTALRGDEVLGVGGIGYRPDGTVIAFAAIKDELRKYPAALHRAGLAGVAMMRASGAKPILAEAQDDNPAAAPWLERLGFAPLTVTIDGEVETVWELRANVE
jgi:hypothetical protein